MLTGRVRHCRVRRRRRWCHGTRRRRVGQGGGGPRAKERQWGAAVHFQPGAGGERGRGGAQLRRHAVQAAAILRPMAAVPCVFPRDKIHLRSGRSEDAADTRTHTHNAPVTSPHQRGCIRPLQLLNPVAPYSSATSCDPARCCGALQAQPRAASTPPMGPPGRRRSPHLLHGRRPAPGREVEPALRVLVADAQPHARVRQVGEGHAVGVQHVLVHGQRHRVRQVATQVATRLLRGRERRCILEEGPPKPVPSGKPRRVTVDTRC